MTTTYILARHHQCMLMIQDKLSKLITKLQQLGESYKAVHTLENVDTEQILVNVPQFEEDENKGDIMTQLYKLLKEVEGPQLTKASDPQ